MKIKNFKFKTIEIGRFEDQGLLNIYGGDIEACNSKYVTTCYPIYDQLCLRYTYCGAFPNGNPGYQYCGADNNYDSCSSHKFVCIWIK